MAEVSREAWIAAFEASVQPPPDDPSVLTIRELAELFGIQRPAAMRRITAMVKAGKAERTTKLVWRQGDTRGRPAPAYRLL